MSKIDIDAEFTRIISFQDQIQEAAREIAVLRMGLLRLCEASEKAFRYGKWEHPHGEHFAEAVKQARAALAAK